MMTLPIYFSLSLSRKKHRGNRVSLANAKSFYREELECHESAITAANSFGFILFCGSCESSCLAQKVFLKLFILFR